MEEGTPNNPKPIDLPADLQVPMANPAPLKTSVGSAPPPLVMPEKDLTLPSAPEPLARSPRRSSHHWLGWLIGILAMGLISATVYFALQYIGFNRGKIKFDFEPAGVSLTIDQKLSKSSVSSITVALKAGSHLIQVSKEGYLDWEQSLDLQAGETAEMKVTLEPVPNMELLSETAVSFPSLINRDKFLAFFESGTGALKAIDLSTKSIIDLFELNLPTLSKVSWSPGGTATMIKLPNIWKLTNMQDNRQVKGQYIPLGDSPAQGPAFSNGIATWLLASERRTAAGIQPVLLNESVRDVAFSPDGSRIVYFYTPADGERSLVRAENIDGSNWMRLLIKVDADNPTLEWLNDDRSILLIDDGSRTDKLFDSVSQEITEIMSDRAKNTLVLGSPEGDRVAYLVNNTAGMSLAIWNIAEQKTETVFAQPVTNFVWQDADTLIVNTADNNLWYWDVGTGRERAVKFASSFGVLQPKQLLYSLLNQTLFILEDARIFSIKA